jgi:hypothetical protein
MVRESDHSVASSAGIKNEWNCTFTPPTRVRGVNRENFTFTCLCLVKSLIGMLGDKRRVLILTLLTAALPLAVCC